MELFTWVILAVVVSAILYLDLCVLNKKHEIVPIEKALKQSGIFVAIAAVFGLVVYFGYGGERVSEYYTGYVAELALSVDNLFVILAILEFFKVPEQYYHRLLYLGILGAIVLRGIFLAVGVAIVSLFWWTLLIMGAVLVVMGIKMFLHANKSDEDEEEEDLQENFAIKILRKYFPITDEFNGDKFTKRIQGVLHLTPMALALVMIETSDILFAFDSIPAVLSISQHMFVVFSSNLFAIMGLRSLFFALSSLKSKFHYLEHGVSIVLVFIGIKLLIGHFFHIDTMVSLIVTLTLLVGSVVLSTLKPPAKDDKEPVTE